MSFFDYFLLTKQYLLIGNVTLVLQTSYIPIAFQRQYILQKFSVKYMFSTKKILNQISIFYYFILNKYIPFIISWMTIVPNIFQEKMWLFKVWNYQKKLLSYKISFVDTKSRFIPIKNENLRKNTFVEICPNYKIFMKKYNKTKKIVKISFPKIFDKIYFLDPWGWNKRWTQVTSFSWCLFQPLTMSMKW
jgi:hypothetical protein